MAHKPKILPIWRLPINLLHDIIILLPRNLDWCQSWYQMKPKKFPLSKQDLLKHWGLWIIWWRKGLRRCCGHLFSLPLIRWGWWGKREVFNRWQKGVCPACLSLTGWLIYWRSRWWILDFWRRKSFVFNTENDTPDYIFKIKGKISKIVAIVSHMRSFLEPFFFKGSKGGKLFLFENTDLQAWICFGEGHRSMQGASRKR